MSSDIWGAAAVASGMWIIASVALIGGDTTAPSNGVLWTLTSSEKVASHPTLVRRSFLGTVAATRMADIAETAIGSNTH